MYCSQFIVYLLSESNCHFDLTKRYVDNPQYRHLLKRDTISYYPVDMFFYDNRFEKVFKKKHLSD